MTAQANQREEVKNLPEAAGSRPTPTSRANETREVFKIVFVGRPGTGKSTVIRKLVRRLLEAHRRVLIVTPHENEWMDVPLVHPRFRRRIATYVGARRMVVRTTKQLHEVCSLFKHGLLVLDDCRAYVRDKVTEETSTMLLSCRQNDVDLCAVGHGFTTIPPLFFTYATHFAVFATTDNVVRRKNFVLNFPCLEAVVRDVNKKALQDPHYFIIVKNE